jgi:hypothetical protein
MKVEVALTELARFKLTGGNISVTAGDLAELKRISDTGEALSWSTVQEFEAYEAALQMSMPEETSARIRALSIYTMVNVWTNQTFV